MNPEIDDVSTILNLIKPPTLEEELSIEKELRIVKDSDDIDELKRYAEAITRQNHEQSRFIAGCLNEIHVLKAKLACATPVKKNLIKRMIGLP
tara:strand:+ start:6542 stop:6820 length:279 start_codon:yes stop_codon:yes gene_type:complete